MRVIPSSRDEVTAQLASMEKEIRLLGVRRLALFGSVVRGEDTAGSDVDILIEFYSERKTYDNYLALCELLERALRMPVDVVTTEALSPYIGPHILAEAIDVIRAA